MPTDLAPDTTQSSSSSHLVRQIGLGSGIAVVIGSMIGSGIFKSPSNIASKLPGPLPILLVWTVGGLFAMCGALTLSEVGGAYPYSGGLYVFIREAFGRLAAFMYGWSNMLITPASNGAVAIVFSQYALRLFGMKPEDSAFGIKTEILAIVAIIVITIMNVLGVKLGAFVQNLTTVAKTGGLAVLILLALFVGLPRGGAAHFTPAIPAGSLTMSMFGLALVSVLFACDGWMNVCFVSGEMVNPRRNVPRAILFGTLTVVIIYVLTNIAYLSVFTVSEVAKSQIIAADTMSQIIGAGGVTFIVATVMLSTLGALNAGVLTSPRIHFAMAEDRLFFGPFASVHPKYRTPHVAIIASGFAGIGYVLLATAYSGKGAFNSLVDACVIGNLPFYAMAVGSIFIFRAREKKRKASAIDTEPVLSDSLVDPVVPGYLEGHHHVYSPPVHAPLYPLTPVLFILSVVVLIANSLMTQESRTPSLAVLAFLSIGFPLYFGVIQRIANKKL